MLLAGQQHKGPVGPVSSLAKGNVGRADSALNSVPLQCQPCLWPIFPADGCVLQGGIRAKPVAVSGTVLKLAMSGTRLLLVCGFSGKEFGSGYFMTAYFHSLPTGKPLFKSEECVPAK